MVTLLPVATLGSSPHAGNGRLTHAVSLSVRGLIPARGERTGGGEAVMTRPPAHPRTRGTDPHHRARSRDAGGSSPHAGNGPTGSGVAAGAGGLIPARGERTAGPSGTMG